MPDTGPWPPLDRPRVWVLHDGQWARGELIAWCQPGTVPGHTAEDGWVGLARWLRPDGSWLQHEFALPQRWLAPGWGPGGEVPAPEVPAGEVGFVPPPRFGQPRHR